MSRRWRIPLGCIGLILCLLVSAQAYHIPSVSEGLLENNGTYVGAYLGGNQGANNQECVNFFQKAQQFPYETQYLDQPSDYGENAAIGIASIDTGMNTFRSDLDSIQPGSGAKQVFVSRYYDMTFYPDNNYGKIPYTPSPAPYIWAEKVIQQGGVPVISLDPYGLINEAGVIDLSVQNAAGTTGIAILEDLGTNLNVITEKYKDEQGKPATVIIWFAHEFNTAPSVNPEANDYIDSPNKIAFRNVFRQAYALLHQYGGEGVQVAWAGNVAQTMEDRMYYWPGYNDTMVQLPNDSVDWVGMTWYPWPGGPVALDSFQGFYDFYAVNRTHPFIFMETSADGWGDPVVEETLKLNQVVYLYNASTLSPYPNIKGIIWFNVVKGEQVTPSNQTLVPKNYLIPDGQWNNYGQSVTIPGDVYSASNISRVMLPAYPMAMMNPWFLSSGQSGPGEEDLGALLANFEASPVSGSPPLAVTFRDISEGDPDYWNYDFGDGFTSTEKNPTHFYRIPGTYTVTQTIMKVDQGTLRRSISMRDNLISVAESHPVSDLVAGFDVSPKSGSAPLKITITDTSSGNPQFWYYDFGDGTFSTSRNPVHTYLLPGTYTLSQTVVQSGKGCLARNKTQELILVL